MDGGEPAKVPLSLYDRIPSPVPHLSCQSPGRFSMILATKGRRSILSDGLKYYTPKRPRLQCGQHQAWSAGLLPRHQGTKCIGIHHREAEIASGQTTTLAMTGPYMLSCSLHQRTRNDAFPPPLAEDHNPRALQRAPDCDPARAGIASLRLQLAMTGYWTWAAAPSRSKVRWPSRASTRMRSPS
jgi:hypothetical protein